MATARGRKRARGFVLLAAAAAWHVGVLAAEVKKTAAVSPWSDWIEPGAPFFSSVVDARRPGETKGADNLTPRGLVLRLEDGLWACFDTELLRVSAVWRGNGVTLKSASQISYHEAGRKAADGQGDMPAPSGTVWLTNGLYAGWQAGENVSLRDPRELAPSPEEVGRGPLREEQGRFRALRRTRAGIVLEYVVGGTRIEELITGTGAGRGGLRRTFRVGPSAAPLRLVAGRKEGAAPAWQPRIVEGEGGSVATLVPDPASWLVAVQPHSGVTIFRVEFGEPPEGGGRAPMPADADRPAATPWPQVIATSGRLSRGAGAYVVDSIPLPLNNPWRRNLRLADIQFLPDGRGYAVTFDGDVWSIDGLGGDLREVRWRRFASGLHEPLGLAVRDGEVFVFDRNGIWRLRDSDGDGAADAHELFSNVVAQSADSREYPNGIKPAPDGSFVIVKGGQVDTYFGKNYGSVLRVARDGRTFSVLGWGFRQPFIGVHPRTGLVTASDQEGQYVPTTPIAVVEDGHYYGFATRLRTPEDHPAAITEPMLWMPRQTNASAASHVWLVGARMGPLNDSLVHLGYNRPEVLVVLASHRTERPQAAVVSLTRDLDFAPLSGAVNPRDGQLYVAGFRIFATTAETVSGLARVRYTGQPSVLPREVLPTDRGLVLRFDVALGDTAQMPSRYSVERWNYRRSHNYGSAHYRMDGTLGQERTRPGRAYLSRDRRSIFVELADMQPGVMQMHVSWSLTSADGVPLEGTTDFTPWQLVPFRPEAEGFGNIQGSAVPIPMADVAAVDAPPASVEEGRRVAGFLGCVACHTPDGTKGLGPTWKSAYGATRPLADGTTVEVDEAYLRESILTPGAKIAQGFENGMPTYAGVASEAQIASLVLYIKSLR